YVHLCRCKKRLPRKRGRFLVINPVLDKTAVEILAFPVCQTVCRLRRAVVAEVPVNLGTVDRTIVVQIIVATGGGNTTIAEDRVDRALAERVANGIRGIRRRVENVDTTLRT